jgi:TolA-binding protein
MRRLSFLLMAVALLSGCGDKAKELYETAQFEERQNNREHAKQLYEEIIRDYPKSETARKAAERLVSLTPSP